MNIPLDQLPQTLRQLRQTQGLHLKTIAQKANTSTGTVSHHERGIRNSIHTNARIARALGYELRIDLQPISTFDTIA